MTGEIEYRKGLWTKEEDKILSEYVIEHGKGKWNRISKITGLKRCGKSCRMRWLNYLCPNIKRGNFSEEEEDLIIRLHKLLGNRWSLIAGRVPGRTDNQVKNYWNTCLKKKIGGIEEKRRKSAGKRLAEVKEESQSIPALENFEELQSSEVTVVGDPQNEKEIENWEWEMGRVEPVLFDDSAGWLEFFDPHPVDATK